MPTRYLEDGATPVVQFDQLTLDVPAAGWVVAATAARDDAELACFDWLSAVDEEEAGFDVVLSVYSPTHRQRALLRTRVPRSSPRPCWRAPRRPSPTAIRRATSRPTGAPSTPPPGPARN